MSSKRGYFDRDLAHNGKRTSNICKHVINEMLRCCFNRSNLLVNFTVLHHGGSEDCVQMFWTVVLRRKECIDQSVYVSISKNSFKRKIKAHFLRHFNGNGNYPEAEKLIDVLLRISNN